MRAPTAILAPLKSTKHWKPARPVGGCGRLSAYKSNSRATTLGIVFERQQRGEAEGIIQLHVFGMTRFTLHFSLITITVGCVLIILRFSADDSFLTCARSIKKIPSSFRDEEGE